MASLGPLTSRSATAMPPLSGKPEIPRLPLSSKPGSFAAGLTGPAAKNRRNYWTSERYPAEPEDFLQIATENRGSWWPAWSQWLARHGGGKRAAPSAPGNVQYRPIEAAPGRYVKQRIH